MRRSIASVALLAAVAASACTDTPPTGTQPNVGQPLFQATLEEHIDQKIEELFPNGLETASGAKWKTVQDKKAAGDMEGAKKHLADLSDWIDKKTPEIIAPQGETQKQAAVGLVYSMWQSLLGLGTAIPTFGGDAELAVVAAGAEATVVVPSENAGVHIRPNSTKKTRVIVVAQKAQRFPELCDGPLPTPLCQSPLFYEFHSFGEEDPDGAPGEQEKLEVPANFAVCLVNTGNRAPLDRPGETTVHNRTSLAHNRPPAGKETPGGIIKPEWGEIEVLPLSKDQKGFTKCEEPVSYALGPAAVRGGWIGRSQRALLAIASFAGRLVTPKNLYAYDVGPEHEGLFFSDFNAVDTGSQPDLSVSGLTAPTEATVGSEISVGYTVSNISRRSGGNATAAAPATTASVYLTREVPDEGEGASATTEQRLLKSGVQILATRPDAAPVVIDGADALVTIPGDIEPDDWTVEVRIDATSSLGEVTLGNNVATAVISIRGTRVLIYGPSMSVTPFSGPNNEKTIAEGLGMTVDVVSAATWGEMTQAQFAQYRAIIIGDPTCSQPASILDAVAANSTVWSPVIQGPITMNGTDPIYHQNHSEAVSLVRNSIAFAASVPGKTGLYVSLSCYYAGAPANTALTFMSSIGNFQVTGQGCVDQVAITQASHPVMADLTNAGLSGWGCTIHETFSSMTSFPSDFQVLAVYNTAPSGSAPSGPPVVIARAAIDTP
jgi:hypothetical protein